MKNFAKILVGIFIFISADCKAQTDQEKLNSLAANFINNLRKDNREKVFLHTDKWYYIAGEDLWFKAYCINALSHKIFHHSKIFFVDLVNDKDSVIEHLFLNNKLQNLDGKISLSGLLPEGYYWLRAYTQNMPEQDVNGIYVQPVYIFNSKNPAPDNFGKKINTSVENSANIEKPELTFLPEGGSIISGTTAAIAFTVTGKNKKPLDISGYVTDTRDSVVSQFKTSLPGLGKFSFFVWKSRKYTAHVKWNNKDITYPLPLVNQFSSQLSIVDQNNESAHLQVSLGDSLYKKNKQTFVLGISKDSLCFAAVGSDMYDFTIQKNIFPDGKATFLLFDDEQQVISQRDIYIQNNNKGIAVTPKNKYGAREKVKLDVAVKDSNRQSTLSLLSVAVTDDQIDHTNDFTENIINKIKNDNIEIFPGADVSFKNYTPEQWDLIMLTQKQKFKNPEAIKNETDLSDNSSAGKFDFSHIRGKVVDNKNEPQKNNVITLLSTGNTEMIRTDTTDEAGRFNFEIPEQYGSMKYVLQVANLKGDVQNRKIIIDKPDFPIFKTPTQLKKTFSDEEEKLLNHFKRFQSDTVTAYASKGYLTPVIIKGKKKQEVTYDQSKQTSKFSRIIPGDKISTDFKSVGNALLSVPGISIRNGYVVLLGGSMTKDTTASSVEPLVVMDGVPVTIPDERNLGSSPLLNFLNTLPPSHIDFIEVLSGASGAIYGLQGGNGVILINTKNTATDNSNFSGVMNFSTQGYYSVPPFDEPDYDKKEIKKNPEPDRRSTMYWNGDILTDNNGNATLNFFTADSKTSYTITITGVTASGDILFKKLKMQRE